MQTTIARTNTVTMPPAFLKWQVQSRRDLFEAMLRGEHPRFMAAHLPVVSTSNDGDAAFAIHSATKGVGLLPRSEHLAGYVELISDCVERCRDAPAAETLPERIEVARAFYEEPRHIDDRRFGLIEIFQGRSYVNLVRDPRATLLFTSPGPVYLSYQLNCSARIVTPEDLSFRFIRGMRLLFEMDGFHIRQPEYPFGYVFEVREVFDKTPRRLGTACPHGVCQGWHGRRSEATSPVD